MKLIAQRGSPVLTLALSLALVPVIALGGCVASAEPRASQLEGAWVLDSLGAPQGLSPADPSVTTNITFGDGEVQGSGGVNSFSGTYEAADGGDLTFGALQSTEMAGSPQAMEQEGAFFSALQETRHFELNGGKLILTSSGNDTLAILIPE